jgi:tripartite-type tricarboxylate transporter receptor subunit TctC
VGADLGACYDESETSHRRQFLHLAAAAVALPVVSRVAWGQTYPSRPVRIIVGFPAGGQADIVARLIGRWLQQRLGQPFVVENRPGAAGNIAAEAVVRAVPDGHTLLMATAAVAVNATLYDKLNFDLMRDITPVASLIRVPLLLELNPLVPAKTVSEFIAYAKANPGKISMASPGIGTATHMAGELFKMMTGVEMLHVPYRGDAPALTDVIGGQVQVIFGNMPPSLEHVRAGKLRAVAVTTAIRSAALPDVPTVGEFVPGYEASNWVGIGAPKSTPTEIVGKLTQEINAGLTDSKMRAQLADLGGTPLPGSPGDFGKLIAEEIEKWAKVVKVAGIKPE